jgi:hypothetical protein
MNNLQHIEMTNWRRLRSVTATIAAPIIFTLLAGCAGSQLSPESAASPVSVQAPEGSPQIAATSLNDETTTSIAARLKHSHNPRSATDHHPTHSGHSSSDPKINSQNAMYTCPMHPEIKKADPGACSICGMNLVPI